MFKPTAQNQRVPNGGPLPKGIGLRHSGGEGQNAPKPLSNFKPIKYPTQGKVPVSGKLI
jgi:hypothetical protein